MTAGDGHPGDHASREQTSRPRLGGPSGASVIDAACARGDEPAEMLAYWKSRYGNRVPKAVKRGVARAAQRLYTERASLRYDGTDRPWRMADVVELTHPVPKGEWQSRLFRLLLDKRRVIAQHRPTRQTS